MSRYKTALKIILRSLVLFSLFIVSVLFFFRLESRIRESVDPRLLAPRDGKFIETSRARIFLQERGPKTGPAVLFIHGSGGWSEGWKPSLDALGDAGFRAIAIDVPPFGLSSPTVDARYDSESLAKLLTEALDAISVRDFVLVGHSFGAKVTVALAKQQQDRVKALVLANAALRWDEENSAPPPALLSMILERTWARNVLASLFTSKLSTGPAMRSFVLHPETVSKDWEKRFQPPLEAPGKTEAIGDWLVQLLMSNEMPAPKEGFYPAFSKPTLVIWGSHDTVTPPWQGDRLVKLFPNGNLQTIQDIGHMPYIENPKKFHALILDFLKAR